MKKTYFLSDAHLGSWALKHKRTHERRLVSFLDSIKKDAQAIYLLGDIFDYWYEYKHVVPKGYTRFLGKISELTDRGIDVHFFTGNHDLWCLDYFEKECGMIIHREPFLAEINGKEFYLAHGDEFSDDKLYKILRRMFRCAPLKSLFSMLHPDISLYLGLSWANHSMVSHKINGDTEYMGEEKESCIIFSRKYLNSHPGVDYFIFGHRHCDATVKLGETSECIIMGDWISAFSYVEFDGIDLKLKHYVEGDEKTE